MMKALFLTSVFAFGGSSCSMMPPEHTTLPYINNPDTSYGFYQRRQYHEAKGVVAEVLEERFGVPREWVDLPLLVEKSITKGPWPHELGAERPAFLHVSRGAVVEALGARARLEGAPLDSKSKQQLYDHFERVAGERLFDRRGNVRAHAASGNEVLGIVFEELAKLPGRDQARFQVAHLIPWTQRHGEGNRFGFPMPEGPGTDALVEALKPYGWSVAPHHYWSNTVVLDRSRAQQQGEIPPEVIKTLEETFDVDFGNNGDK
jgi:hypothetical protein